MLCHEIQVSHDSTLARRHAALTNFRAEQVYMTDRARRQENIFREENAALRAFRQGRRVSGSLERNIMALNTQAIRTMDLIDVVTLKKRPRDVYIHGQAVDDDRANFKFRRISAQAQM